MLKKVNLKGKSYAIGNLYEYLKVGQINDHMLNIVNVENRTLDFHIHEDSDEMFFIIEGKMQVELEDGLIDLAEGDFVIVPKGTKHRPVCTSLVRCLMLEKNGTLTNENSGGTYQK